MPSLTHQWFLLSFATEVVKTPLALSSHVSPNRHVHLTSALLPPPPLTTCYSLFPQRCEVCCLIILVSDLSRVRMHVRCIHESSCSCDIQCHGGLVINSTHFILQEFYHFCSYFRLFCSLLGRSSTPSKLSHPSPFAPIAMMRPSFVLSLSLFVSNRKAKSLPEQILSKFTVPDLCSPPSCGADSGARRTFQTF